MIVGIVSLVLCFAFVGGVAAIVLGAIGLGKAKQLGGLKKGQALAGVILGALSILIGIGAWIAIARGSDEVNDALDGINGPAATDTFDVTVETCEIDEFGNATAEGTITNTSNRARSFEVEVEFVRAGEVVDSTSTIVSDIEPGAQEDWSVPGAVDGSDNVRCTVPAVNNFFN